ncbi:MAG: acyl--CoA ligase [Burkholderiales bacterium]|nr:acyl--CoA ligase [Burkholderiales bacterium]
MLAEAARANPASTALIDTRAGAERRLSFAEFDAAIARVAATLQREGLGAGATVAVIAAACAEYLIVFFGALRARLAVAPLAPSSTPAQLADMLADCEAHFVFVDADAATALRTVPLPAGTRVVLLHGTPGEPALAFESWLAAPGTLPAPVRIEPAWPFNIIYSSGTTGTPKGIVQSHAMRWAHIRRGSATGYGPGSVTLTATPLYSNTTLVSVIPSLAWGGAVVLMAKFDALAYLQLAERHRATHTMLVPVQYQRLMAHPRFGDFDLRSFVAKFCTSAPFHAELKAEVLRRWPGGLTEYYGMTEGGGTCILACHEHPTKLHTVGPPAEGHDIRLIDEDACELPPEAVRRGASGEVVGRSPGMMSGYHRQPGRTAEAEWFDAEGRRYIRTGDVGHFDADGFLVLTDRRKDMVISGGFNIYPSDLEAVLRRHPAVADVAVFGVPSEQWGETPVAAVVLREAAEAGIAQVLQEWANAQVGKTQRISALRVVAELPRSAIGKVLRRELREQWLRRSGGH